MNPLHCVVLFDIDGTLLTGPGSGPSPGVLAMGEAAHGVTGVDGLHQQVEFAGRTDRQIARDLLRASKTTLATEPASASAIDRLLELYVQRLEDKVLERPYRALADARGAASSLKAVGATVGLGTGNLCRGAQAKLKSAGLLDLFDPMLGGFADDAEPRDELLRCGKRKCDPSGKLPVVIVGDTPHDVHAAHLIGAFCVGVATGLFSAHRLQECGADVVLLSLDKTLVEVIRGLIESSEVRPR